ncbi:MAG: hypothetical protein GC171_10945 [Terrimonas sp.]|nr:hypothetical protein [Terrimonas sp.]
MKQIRFQSLLFFCLWLSACTNNPDTSFQPVPPATGALLAERWDTVRAAENRIREGDLVLRCGDDMTSFMLKDFSQTEKMYSHSGLAFSFNDTLYIFHNMAGDLNPDEVMRKDPLDSFLTPTHNVIIGIYRFDFTQDELQKLKSIVLEYYREKLQFDMSFDLRTDDKMYCVEMIAKSIERATGNRIVFSKSIVNRELKRKYLKMALQKKVLPSGKSADQREYLAIDNLYLNPHCHTVYKKVFAENNGPVMIPSPENNSN